MIFKVLAVYDVKAQAFMTPFFTSTLAVGVRSFTAAVNAKGTAMGDSPGDFTLYELGTFNDEKAEFELLPQRRNLGMGINFIRKES